MKIEISEDSKEGEDIQTEKSCYICGNDERVAFAMVVFRIDGKDGKPKLADLRYFDYDHYQDVGKEILYKKWELQD